MSTDSVASDYSTADLNAMVDAAKRAPLDTARRLLDAASSDFAKRDYLREIGSDYAESEWQTMQGAYTGNVLAALASLANAYENEITRHA